MIHLVTGSMYSGKSEYIIKRVKDLREKGVSVACFKPSRDTRDKQYIRSRALAYGVMARFIPTDSFKDPFYLTPEEENSAVIVIDEVQFVDVNVINYLITQWVNKKEGRVLLLAGLEKDFLNKDFATISFIKMFNPIIERLKADCFICGKSSLCSSRRVHNNKIVLQGQQVAIEGKKFEYIALCPECDEKKLKEVEKC